ncbi:E3 ubiquitin-protein ligase TRIM39-like [Centroberyx affinis]|uniref:E3 ubiquitin-protein ligase TRIM39-like n=1 Tax=Centroberyx affinis TaxID=166261 RepID=UPI003A5BA494
MASKKPASSETMARTRKQIRDLQRATNSCMALGKPSIGKPDLKEMQTLTECLEFLKNLAKEVKDISQLKQDSERSAPEGDTAKPRSLESSSSLILRWAKELDQINMLKKETKATDKKMIRRKDPGGTEKNLEKQNERLQQWAIELRNIKEEAISMLWLPTKQKAWRTGTGSPKYIPNSALRIPSKKKNLTRIDRQFPFVFFQPILDRVWQWIHSASVSVQLDPSTSHPWLVVSANRLQVQEAAGLQHTSTIRSTARRFDGWPCVLGDTAITGGRHYWEVEVSRNGCWRMGVMSLSAPRKQKPPMSPSTGYWVLWQGSSLWACTDKPTELPGAAVPRLVGVYVDVGEGQVSFYDVDNRVHIYTFSDTFQDSLVPVFGCLDGDTVLKIIPPEMSVTAADA